MATPLALPAFRLALPDGWTEQTVYMFLGPEEGEHKHHLTLQVDDDPATTDLAEYTTPYLQGQMETLPQAETIKNEMAELPGGVEGYVTVVKWQPSEDQVLLRKQVVVVRGETVFVLAGDFTKKSMPILGGQMETMAATINLPGAG